MNRRDTLLALIALGASPLAAEAQQTDKVWRIGYLSNASGQSGLTETFSAELGKLGYVEGRNMLIEYRWGMNEEERLAELAAELVQLKVDVIVTQAQQALLAAKQATSTIPIVIATAADPVGSGMVASLARPGGNITGMTFMSSELSGKRIQLLREIVPRATRVAVLVIKGGPAVPMFLAQMQGVAKQTGTALIVEHVNEVAALDSAFDSMRRQRTQVLIVQSNPFSTDNRKRIVELAAKQHLPTIFEVRAGVDAGALISYGPDLLAMYRRAAYYVDRIFKGTKPADLPVEQPTKFEMIVNLKTAKALGIKIPQSVLIRADEVIQ
jgi:putative ABC transport system substrate-binding protein